MAGSTKSGNRILLGSRSMGRIDIDFVDIGVAGAALNVVG